MPATLSPFRRAAAAAVAEALGTDVELPVTSPPDASLGDYAVGCFPVQKALGMKAVEAARRAVETFRPTELLASAQAAGPYVNFRVERAALYRQLVDGARAGTLLPAVGAGKTILVDFSSPNIA